MRELYYADRPSLHPVTGIRITIDGAVLQDPERSQREDAQICTIDCRAQARSFANSSKGKQLCFASTPGYGAVALIQRNLGWISLGAQDREKLSVLLDDLFAATVNNQAYDMPDRLKALVTDTRLSARINSAFIVSLHKSAAGVAWLKNPVVSPQTTMIAEERKQLDAFLSVLGGDPVPYVSMRDRCMACSKFDATNLLKCSACAIGWYCSKQCQALDWPKHKHGCQRTKARLAAENAQASASGMTGPL